MSGTATGADSAPSLPRRAFHLFSDALGALGTIWIFALVLLVCADVFGRSLLGAPVRGVAEIVSMSIVGIVFLQLASASKAGRLTRSDAVLQRLLLRRPRIGLSMEVAFHLSAAALFLVLFEASLPYFARAWERGEYVGALGDFTAPTWPVRLLILVGSIAAALQFLLTAADALRRLVRGRP